MLPWAGCQTSLFYMPPTAQTCMQSTGMLRIRLKWHRLSPWLCSPAVRSPQWWRPRTSRYSRHLCHHLQDLSASGFFSDLFSILTDAGSKLLAFQPQILRWQQHLRARSVCSFRVTEAVLPWGIPSVLCLGIHTHGDQSCARYVSRAFSNTLRYFIFHSGFLRMTIIWRPELDRCNLTPPRFMTT